MPTPRAREPSIEYTSEYKDFIAKLTTYHKKRGTHFDPEPRVGSKHVDLLTLFKTVTERGGYDKVSEEKLAWRKLGQDFNLGSSNLPALAFSLKTTYYRNLAAYEISTIHDKEPPPKEILEDVTAKGGGLLTRTTANYRPSGRRERGSLGVDQSDASGDDGTPARDTIGTEETPGSGSRATRGLRQAPPQRVIFQPDTLPARHSRHAPASAPVIPQAPKGPSFVHNPSSNPDNMSQAVSSYEPRHQMPLTLRPVVTPANSPADFSPRRMRMLREQAAAPIAKNAPNARMILPGTGFEGPNIYVRCLLSLKSGIPSEQDYALHHLVKISMERGDKYRFESFPGLAEALIDKMLEVGSLFYEVKWDVAYLEGGPYNPHALNGVEGTPDILKRIENLTKKDVIDSIQTAEFSDLLLQINEAALAFRNMAMLEENVKYISELHPLRDFLSIALNLPNLECVVELKHYALEIAEQLMEHLHVDVEDPLYKSLMAQLESQDRGAIVTSLRAINRISMNLDETNRLDGISAKTVQRIMDWTLLVDEELIHACLDFLYQFTAVPYHINFMIVEGLYIDALVNQLVRLVLLEKQNVENEPEAKEEVKRPTPTVIPTLPDDLLEALLKLEEPERSSQWLRSTFEEDKDESITQIALWQAYQARFAFAVQDIGRPLLPAAEFIKNVSTTFAEKAAAQVQAGPVPKFIIKGIRARHAPVDQKGREYSKCLWGLTDSYSSERRDCGQYFLQAEQMYDHVLTVHARARKNDEGKYPNTAGNFTCKWDGCSKNLTDPPVNLSGFATHVKIHVVAQTTAAKKQPASNGPLDSQTVKRPKASWLEPTKKEAWGLHEKLDDESRQAAGIPLTALLVLRNLARNIPKTEAEEIAMKEEDSVSYVDKFFKPVQEKLWEIFANNKNVIMRDPLCSLIGAIEDA